MAQYAWDQAEFEFAEDFLDLVEYVIDFEPTVDYGVQRIWEAFQRSIVRPRDLRLLLNRLVGDYERDLDPNDPEDANIYNYLEELLEEVARLWSGKWLMGHLHGFQEQGLTGQGVLVATDEVERLVTAGIGGTRIQKPLRGERLIFLHLIYFQDTDDQEMFRKPYMSMRGNKAGRPRHFRSMW